MASGSPSTVKSITKKKKAGTNGVSNTRPNGLYVSVDFEVHGKVQKVHFRKFTKAKAQSLGIRGWCRNTEKGTVVGVIQGLGTSLNAMKFWLRSTGSPKSKVERIDFENERRLNGMDYLSFEILP